MANAGRGGKDFIANQNMDIRESKMAWVKSGGNITQIQVVVNQEVGILAQKGIELIDQIGQQKVVDVQVNDEVLGWDYYEMKRIIQKAILKHWLQTGLTVTEIADHLNMRRTYLSKLISKYDVRNS
jgi:YesN/AraC family two-component response regulator